MQLADVAYEAGRDDGIRLEIPGTGIWTRIPGDRLQSRRDHTARNRAGRR
jgi:hypothetical protein